MSTCNPSKPLIAIVGATGTGKSQVSCMVSGTKTFHIVTLGKLAVDIARRFDGEIINGDAVQLYEGLPIITNKISPEEQRGIPHHLLGCIKLHEQTWTVSDFVSAALQTIKEIRSRGKLPILVGGTHYYTQSLLFHNKLAQHAVSEPQSASVNLAKTWPILDAPTEEILAKLSEVDPVMANRWHPNDRRKISRSLEIWLQTGRKASDIYKEQQQGHDATSTDQDDASQPSALRTDTLILWVNAETELLTDRLNSRVDKMVQDGLLEEVDSLAHHAEQSTLAGEAPDMTKGIWVAIGFKEFLDYHKAKAESQLDPPRLAALMDLSKCKTKIATRQYAKGQIRWIRIKLAHAVGAAGAKDRFFMLDGSDLATWQHDVSDKSTELVDSFLHGRELPAPPSLSPLAAEMLAPKRSDMSAQMGSWTRQHCEACDKTFVTEFEWTQHVKSRKHRLTKKAKEPGNENLRDGARRGYI